MLFFLFASAAKNLPVGQSVVVSNTLGDSYTVTNQGHRMNVVGNNPQSIAKLETASAED